MAKAKKNNATTRTYLTKRRLVSAARSGIRIAAANAMEVMGYTIIAHEGWVVKKYADGQIEKIKPLANQEENTGFKLD